MSAKKTITINGRLYDAVTGLPVKAPIKPKLTGTPKTYAEKPIRSSVEAKGVHSNLQRSTTLKRSIVKKAKPAPKHPTRGRLMDISKSPQISKFAAHPVVKKPEEKEKLKAKDKGPQPHPVAIRALRKGTVKPVATKPKSAAATSKAIKDAAIAKALAPAPPAPKAKKKLIKRKKRQLETWKKRFLIGLACAALLIGGAYAIYRFVPSISVAVAASQAGVKASYPEYIPDGFRLHHPVTYTQGEVILVFNSNSNDDSYTITQSKSSWDSSAVLDNIVKKAAGDNYLTTTERGLTLYTYNNTDASWVNGGVLYTITSNAQLSNDQIRRIATSL